MFESFILSLLLVQKVSLVGVIDIVKFVGQSSLSKKIKPPCNIFLFWNIENIGIKQAGTSCIFSQIT